jgi:general stress protein 26
MARQNTQKIIWDHVRSIRICMMVTHGDGGIRARPMVGLPRPEQNAIWFFADRESETDADARLNAPVCLTFADLKENTYVSLSGGMSRVQDRETINALWDEEAGSYFPSGPDDPRLLLLRFEPAAAEYWSAPSSPIVIAINFIGAKVTGQRPKLGSKGSTSLP